MCTRKTATYARYRQAGKTTRHLRCRHFCHTTTIVFHIIVQWTQPWYSSIARWSLQLVIGTYYITLQYSRLLESNRVECFAWPLQVWFKAVHLFQEYSRNTASKGHQNTFWWNTACVRNCAAADQWTFFSKMTVNAYVWPYKRTRAEEKQIFFSLTRCRSSQVKVFRNLISVNVSKDQSRKVTELVISLWLKKG